MLKIFKLMVLKNRLRNLRYENFSKLLSCMHYRVANLYNSESRINETVAEKTIEKVASLLKKNKIEFHSETDDVVRISFIDYTVDGNIFTFEQENKKQTKYIPKNGTFVKETNLFIDHPQIVEEIFIDILNNDPEIQEMLLKKAEDLKKFYSMERRVRCYCEIFPNWIDMPYSYRVDLSYNESGSTYRQWIKNNNVKERAIALAKGETL